MSFIINHSYIFLSIAFAVSSQLIIKWKMEAVIFPSDSTILEKFIFAFTMLFNPYIMLSVVFTLLSGLSWMIAMTKFEISYAYPFTILGFIFVTVFSVLFFGENIDIYKLFGLGLIILGILVISRSM